MDANNKPNRILVCLSGLLALGLVTALIWALSLTRAPFNNAAGSPVPQVLAAGSGVELLAGEEGGDCVELRVNGVWEFRSDICDALPTPTPTATSLPGVTPSPSPTATPMGGHDDTAWHLPSDEMPHHHGVNPAGYIDIFGDVLADYLAEYGEISYPWQTPNENINKHEGYIWLYTQARNGVCDQEKQDGDAHCVTDVLVQVHSIGTPHAVTVRNHSFVAFVRACDYDYDDPDACGVVMTGGWHDYGILHCPYKLTHCPLDSDPDDLVADLGFEVVKHQQPYRTSHTRPGGPPSDPEIVQFWAAQPPNPIIAAYFPHQPNHAFGITWSSHDAWGVIDPADPHGSPMVCPDGSCDLNHSRFQIFTANVQDVPAGPFTGWTNRWGHVVTGCTVAGVDCVPLVVTAGWPGDSLLNRIVRHGDPDYAPILDFDTCDGCLLPSLYGTDH